MDFCKSFFGKSLLNLTYDDIVHYFSVPRTENAGMEFKSYVERSTFDDGLQKVIRGISSFLNSSGGVLIWGAPTITKLDGNEVFVGKLNPVKELKDKDTIINRIGSAITPLPIGINVETLGTNGNFVYVFEVQESPYKPHQFNYQYFIRLDGQSRPAPHYIIDALMKRISYPNLCGVIKFHDMQPDFQIPQLINMPISIAMFNFSELQNEESVSFRLLCVGGYFPAGKAILKFKTNPSYSFNGCELIYENFANVLHFGTPVKHDNSIVFTTKTLKQNGGRLELLLSFGGKKSPAKMSHYVFNISILPHFRCELVGCDENVLFADNSSQLGRSIQDSLRAFTER